MCDSTICHKNNALISQINPKTTSEKIEYVQRVMSNILDISHDFHKTRDLDIVVPTYQGHLDFIKKFLETFNLNCEDHYRTNIYLIISKCDDGIFKKLIVDFPDLNIIIVPFADLIKEYEHIEIDENELLKTIGKFNFQSLKKMYGVLNADSEHVCLFDSECLFIRKFKLSDYIEENKNKYFYCSKMINNSHCDETHAKYMQKSMNELFQTNDPNWYLETYLWILRKNVLLDMKNFLEQKYGKLTEIRQEFFVEYGYYLFCRMHPEKYDFCQWFDTCQLLQEYMPEKQYQFWYDNTHPWCMFEHIGLHLQNANYEHLEQIKLIYELLNFPIFRLFEHDRVNQLFLLLCNTIKICVSEFCPEVYDLIMQDVFNKKIGIFISGLYRECDDIKHCLQFIYPACLDTHYYLTSYGTNIYSLLKNNHLTRSIKINNATHPFDKQQIMKIPVSKESLVQNTVEMLYKKNQFKHLLPKYDIVIHMRPDLVTFDKHVIDLLLDMFKHNEPDVLYTTNIYNSVGVNDTFAMGYAHVMEKYLNIYEHIDNLAKNNIFNPELLLYTHLKSNNVQMIPLDWNYKINWHTDQLLNIWWRHEPDIKLTRHNYNEYLQLKTNSYKIIQSEFTDKNKKYQIKNLNTGLSLYIYDLHKSDCLCMHANAQRYSKFYIYHPSDLTIRVNIQLDKYLENLNKDSTGWNLFTIPDNHNILGRGNNGSWAQFYLEKENDYYYIASYHSANIPNRSGTFGRYLGIIDNNVVADLEQCELAKWIIIETK